MITLIDVHLAPAAGCTRGNPQSIRVRAGQYVNRGTPPPGRAGRAQLLAQVTLPRHISSLVPSPHTTYRGGRSLSAGSFARRVASWVQVTRNVSPGLIITGVASGTAPWLSKSYCGTSSRVM